MAKAKKRIVKVLFIGQEDGLGLVTKEKVIKTDETKEQILEHAHFKAILEDPVKLVKEK